MASDLCWWLRLNVDESRHSSIGPAAESDFWHVNGSNAQLMRGMASGWRGQLRRLKCYAVARCSGSVFATCASKRVAI